MSTFDLKERIASCEQFSAAEKLLLQEAINTVANTNGVIERGNPTWKTLPAEKVFEAGAKRCPTCGAAVLE
jgi:hypothetical protein